MVQRRFTFTEDRKREAARIVERYPTARSAVLPMLWLVQGQEGFVSNEAADCVAELVGIGTDEVEDVASFYSMIRREPGPLHLIRACRGICCMMKGSGEIADRIRERLGMGDGGVSDDGRFSLATVECLGLCERAPAIMVGERVYGELTVERVDAILKELGAKI